MELKTLLLTTFSTAFVLTQPSLAMDEEAGSTTPSTIFRAQEEAVAAGDQKSIAAAARATLVTQTEDVTTGYESVIGVITSLLATITSTPDASAEMLAYGQNLGLGDFWKTVHPNSYFIKIVEDYRTGLMRTREAFNSRTLRVLVEVDNIGNKAIRCFGTPEKRINNILKENNNEIVTINRLYKSTTDNLESVQTRFANELTERARVQDVLNYQKRQEEARETQRRNNVRRQAESAEEQRTTSIREDLQKAGCTLLSYHTSEYYIYKTSLGPKFTHPDTVHIVIKGEVVPLTELYPTYKYCRSGEASASTDHTRVMRYHVLKDDRFPENCSFAYTFRNIVGNLLMEQYNKDS